MAGRHESPVRSYEMLVGQVVVAWASIEHLLDICISLDLATGGRTAMRKPQQTLSAKIASLRRAAATNQSFAPYAARLGEILDTIEIRKDDRHRLAHGMVQRFVTEDLGGVELMRLIRGLDHVELVTLATPELDAMRPAAERIAKVLYQDVAFPLLGSLLPAARQSATGNDI